MRLEEDTWLEWVHIYYLKTGQSFEVYQQGCKGTAGEVWETAFDGDEEQIVHMLARHTVLTETDVKGRFWAVPSDNIAAICVELRTGEIPEVFKDRS